MSFSSWTSWFMLLGMIAVCFLPDYVYKMMLYYFHPSEQQKARVRICNLTICFNMPMIWNKTQGSYQWQ